MIIVSACLCGVNCKYSGGNNKNEKVLEFLKGREYEMVCPEEFGGLPTPRTPSEIVDSNGEIKVLTKEGKDVTMEFLKGAEMTLEKAKKIGTDLAILKSRSPSCGKGKVYTGEFNGTLKEGNGLTADLLIKNNIKVITEEEL